MVLARRWAVFFSIFLLIQQEALCFSTARKATGSTSSSASANVAATTSTISNSIIIASDTSHPVCEYHQLTIPTSESGPPRQAISTEDLTPHLNRLVDASGLYHGVITVTSRHTTTAITINERESRLARDCQDFFLKLIPPDERSESGKRRSGIRYLHNDINQRPESEEEAQRCRDNGWDIDNAERLQAWRDQEPINAHSHLLSMLLGSSESIPVVNGKLAIGQWQSVLLLDLDGPRDRTVAVQLMGYAAGLEQVTTKLGEL